MLQATGPSNRQRTPCQQCKMLILQSQFIQKNTRTPLLCSVTAAGLVTIIILLANPNNQMVSHPICAEPSGLKVLYQSNPWRTNHGTSHSLRMRAETVVPSPIKKRFSAIVINCLNVISHFTHSAQCLMMQLTAQRSSRCSWIFLSRSPAGAIPNCSLPP